MCGFPLVYPVAILIQLPWLKAVTYIFGQLIGAWLGALIVFANYSSAISTFEGGNGQRMLKSAGLFSTYQVRYFLILSPFFSVSDSGINVWLARLHVFSKLLF